MVKTTKSKVGATDDALRASEERFRTLIEKAPIAIGMARSGVTLYANPKYLEMYGFESVDEVRGRSIGEQWAPGFRAEIEERARKRTDGQPVPTEYEGMGQRKDGSTFPVHATVTLVQLADGPCTVGFLTDISERERALEALRASEDRFRTLIEKAPIAIGLGRHAVTVYANPKYLEMYGFESVGEVRGRSIGEQFAPSCRVEIEERARQRADGLPVPNEYEAVGQRKDGSSFPVHVAATVVQLADGPCTAGFLTDITQRKRAEEELARSELYFRSLIENAVDITAILAPEGHLHYVSPSVERVLGYKPGDVSGLNVFDLIHPEDRERAAGRLQRTLGTGTRFERFEFRVKHRDGSWRTLSFIGKSLPPETGMTGLILNAQDLTERQQLEAQLRQAQKMEAVGRLAGGVAHDFNNLLTVIQGYGESLRSSLAAEDPNSAGVDEILKAAERAAGLTRQLLAFSRKQILSPKIIRLNAIVAEMEKMVRRLIGEDVKLVISLGTKLGCVKADPGQIEQVLMNLTVNARDAMPDGGQLTIEVANTDLDGTAAKESGHPEPGAYVMLAVSDTGVGMDPETLTHLFEPFFTTKGPGKGTGLGLATVYGIVKQSGGYIWASSIPGNGSTFRIYLPRIATEDAFVQPDRVADAPGGHETILVVEDDAAVRRIAASALASRGYNVLEAGNAAHGLQLAERHPGQIDLLLTDVIMPGVSGREMAERIVAGRPGLRVLFMSGYFDDTIASHGVLEPGIHLLKKPFTPSSLAREVREILDAVSAGGSP